MGLAGVYARHTAPVSRAGNRTVARCWSLGRRRRFHSRFLDAGILDVEYLVQHGADRGETISWWGHPVAPS